LAVEINFLLEMSDIFFFIETWHMNCFESEHAARESCALLSFLLKPSETQLVSASFPVGIVVHTWVWFTKASSTSFPDEHHENVRSDAQNRPSLLAEVQKLGCNGNSEFN
jgi:hypothetical protein